MLQIDRQRLNKLMKKFNQMPEDLQRRIMRVNQVTSMKIHSGAVVRAQTNIPNSNGFLASQIKPTFDGTSANVTVHTFYAPYVEFGTGRFAKAYLADKDEEWRKYARTFFVNGKGTTEATPFLFPTAEEVKPDHIKRMKEALANSTAI